MQESFYLLRIAASAAEKVREELMSSDIPTHVRLATRFPISNWGRPEGVLLDLHARGVVIGTGDGEASNIMVPWPNVSYLADGTALAQKR